MKSTDTALARLQALALDSVGPLTSLLEKKASSGESLEDAMDLQIVEGAVHSALVSLGNASAQFSVYCRTKVLEDFNKGLISFVEEKESELRTAAPQLFGSAFTKQEADHLEQVEMLRKSKAKGKSFFPSPLAETSEWQGGADPTAIQGVNMPAVQGNFGSNSKEVERTITHRAEGSSKHVYSFEKINVNHIMQKLHATVFATDQGLQSSLPVAGKLCYFVGNWRVLTADQWVLNIVQGFLIPFQEEPRQVRTPHPYQYPADQLVQLREELALLVSKRAITCLEPTAPVAGFYFTVFLVPKKEGWWRPLSSTSKCLTHGFNPNISRWRVFTP